MDYLTPVTARYNHIRLSDFKTVLYVDSYKLKDNIDRPNLEEDFIDELIGKTVNSLIPFFRKDNPDVTDEQIKGFIDCFMDFELESEYDIKHKQYVVTVVPVWKPVNMIDFKKVEELDFG